VSPQAATEPTVVRSVYVHAPFCARRCFYCDFAVSVRREGGAGEWSAAIAAEVEVLAREGGFALAEELATVFVGGGTPSLLGPDAMDALAEVLGRERLGGADLEWTGEANPESFTPEVAGAWARAGVNRVSLGAQTFDEGALRWMGRLHGPEGPGRAIASARRAGLENLSVDLIFGLPSHLERDWRADLDRVLAFDVPHVSLYGLTVEPGTPLGRAVREGREVAVDEDRYSDEFLVAAELLGAAGYEHYEVSNFARPGARSRHNAVYWYGEPYLGLGNGAHSYAPSIRAPGNVPDTSAPSIRRWNVRSWETYRERVLGGVSPEEGRETVGPAERDLERIWLGLRTRDGLEVPADRADARALTDGWTRDGLATRNRDTVRLTAQGWLVLDRLAIDLDAALRAG
jgi:oxygen-independent coproporphyrinogen-3 oxidase